MVVEMFNVSKEIVHVNLVIKAMVTTMKLMHVKISMSVSSLLMNALIMHCVMTRLAHIHVNVGRAIEALVPVFLKAVNV